jgi:hypothetical protein
MKTKAKLFFLFVFIYFNSHASFDYTLKIDTLSINGFNGLHSFAFAQWDGKWLIIGGRKDGLHARQPFASFPSSQNNTNIYVIDINTKQLWFAPVSSLSTSIAEQLQSTNMNFYQDKDTLYIMGGYAFSQIANDHITFPYLTTLSVSSVVNSVIQGTFFSSYIKQISDTIFQNTGGQLGKIKDTFLLVGGQKFMGRYNPMGNPTFTQSYITKVQKITINNSGAVPTFSVHGGFNDAVNLRRRDYNLLPQIFPDGEEGYTISSGVFQQNVDLPFLYPVDIMLSQHSPQTNFNQYLSNYHSAKSCLYDSASNEMHTLFFGGMSQYYYQNGQLVQDNQVPFVKTISRLTRFADGTLQEYQLPIEMPGLRGAGSEFFPNNTIAHTPSEIFLMNKIAADTILLGHVVGGIRSNSLNPFGANQTNTTSADNVIYAISLIRNTPSGLIDIDGKNPFSFSVSPNPSNGKIIIEHNYSGENIPTFFISNDLGQIIEQGELEKCKLGTCKILLELQKSRKTAQSYFMTIVFDHKFYVTRKIILTE